MRTWLFSLAVLASSSVAWGQTNTLNIPDEVEVGRKIVANCDCPVPEGGKLSILWSTSKGLEFEQVGSRLFVWGQPGQHTVDAVVIPLRTITVEEQTFDVIAGEIQRLNARFQVTGSVEPEPDPDPPGPDPPDPTDPPFPAPGLTILVIREAGAEDGGVTPAQMMALRSATFINYCRSKCVKATGPSGLETVAFRVWDDDLTAQQLNSVPTFLANAYRVLRDGDVRPPVVGISDGQQGVIAPLPADLVELMELVERYGG